jgi:acylphosphatase
MTRDGIARRIFFQGRVQGVGFRYTAASVAESFEITGYVRNLPDGRVELVAEGDPAEVERYQAALESAMRGHIDHVERLDGPATGRFTGFQVTF